MLNENVDHVSPSKYVEYLINDLFPKYKIDTMKNLCINHLAKNCNFSTPQITAMRKMVTDNPKLLSPNDLLKINKCVSYMAFMMKEIYDYATVRMTDGTHLYEIKEKKSHSTELKEKLANLRKSK